MAGFRATELASDRPVGQSSLFLLAEEVVINDQDIHQCRAALPSTDFPLLPPFTDPEIIGSR